MAERAHRGSWSELASSLGRRKLVRAAVVVLALLYASAIYAPLIANDKPYYLRAIDHGAVRSALDTLRPLVDEWEQVLLTLDESAGEQERRAAVARSRAAVEVRLETLRDYARTAGSRAALDAIDGGLQTAWNAYRVDFKSVLREITTVQAAVERAQREFAAGDLAAVSSSPLFASLSSLDVFFMTLWPAALASVLVARGRKRRLLMTLGPVCGAALLWPWLVAGSPGLSSRGIKQAIVAGDIEVERALFPPLPYGFAETNLSEPLRPPTWSASAEIDDEGRYVRGPRRAGADAATGYVPAATPVEVRRGESARNSPWRHLLGTDSLGRDLLARMLWGGRTSLVIGLVAAAVVIALGVAIGTLAGWARGWIDVLVTRAIEVVSSFPAFFVIVVAVALTPAHAIDPLLAIVVVIALVAWTGIARLVRGEVLRVRELEYVLAARALGLSPWRIVWRHVLPNSLTPVIVAGAFVVGWGIVVEAGVSFLGFGVEPPQPSWGALIDDTRSSEHWWIFVFPGAAIALVVLAFHVIGDALRDALDPRLEV